MRTAAVAALGVRRLLAADSASHPAHLHAFGPLPATVDLPGLVERAGLRGRGGSGFPSAVKLRSVAVRGGAVVVANAVEGEPASNKDRTLVARAPHLVLDGLALVARATDARAAYLVTADRETAARADAAARERIDDLPVNVRLTVPRFVAGEESAVASFLDGGPAVPRDRLRRVYEHGVAGRPTLVHNAETLAQVALLARFGPDWFRSVGTVDEPGTFLASVSGDVPRPLVLEAAMGIPLADLVRAGEVSSADVAAVLVGGFHGAWLPGDAIASVRMSRDSLAAHHATVGAGVVMMLGRHRCGVVESARIVRYLADQSAGQCGPCVNGLPALARVLAVLARGTRDRRVVEELRRLTGLLDGRGACPHPAGSVRFVRSAIDVFRAEVAVHLGGGCSAAPAHRLDPL